MNILKIPKKQPSDYFWYFYRCIDYVKRNNLAQVEYFNSNITERYVLKFYFNNNPAWVDLRDDNKLSPTYKNEIDATIFKSNYSSEMWDNPPSDFLYLNEAWEHELRKNIRPFVLGRAFKMSYSNDEFLKFSSKDKEPIYDIFSFSGAGITNETTLMRLKIYELFNSISNKKLIFWLRKHGEEINEEVRKRVSQFECSNPIAGIENFYKQLNEAKYSINFPGICVSAPFRCVDAVLANRAIISTKIWCDIYKTFPCIELPICGYFGTGDWTKAKEILNQLHTYDYRDLTRRARDWYLWYLSPEGMWKNQILKQLC